MLCDMLKACTHNSEKALMCCLCTDITLFVLLCSILLATCFTIHVRLSQSAAYLMVTELNVPMIYVC